MGVPGFASGEAEGEAEGLVMRACDACSGAGAVVWRWGGRVLRGRPIARGSIE